MSFTIRTEKNIDITWFGGEPLLNTKLIDIISNVLNSNNKEFTSGIITNGSLLSEEIIETRFKNWHIEWVQVTLDGMAEEYAKRKCYYNAKENNFDKIVENIDLLLANNVNVSIRLNSDAENREECMRAAAFLKERYNGNMYLTVYPAFLTGDKNNLREMNERIKYTSSVYRMYPPESDKKKIQENSGIVLDNKLFAVTLGDIYGNAFYVLWKDGKFSVEPYLYHDYNVCITAPQNSLELLFTERQHLFAAYMNKEMKIKGSFEDVMVFHQLLSYFTKEKYYVIQEEIISNMLLKQDILDFSDPSAKIVYSTYNGNKRVYNRSIIVQLKKLYRGCCQICGNNPVAEFEEDISEAHHIEFFSRTQNNNSDNIIILCPNHHKLIHKLEPVFNPDKLTFSVGNDDVLFVRLDCHLKRN